MEWNKKLKEIHKWLCKITIKTHLKWWVLKKVRLIWVLKLAKINLSKIKKIETEYLKFKKWPKKLNVKWFKELFEGYLLGWKTRRLISVVKSKPELKEVMDLIKLSGDLSREKGKTMDNFSK